MDPLQIQIWMLQAWAWLSPALAVVALLAIAALIRPFRFLWMSTRARALAWLLGAVAMIASGPFLLVLPYLSYLVPEWISAIADYFGFMKGVPDPAPPPPPASPVF